MTHPVGTASILRGVPFTLLLLIAYSLTPVSSTASTATTHNQLDSSLSIEDAADHAAGISVARVAVDGWNASSSERAAGTYKVSKSKRELTRGHCDNEGKFLNGKCECPFPYTGDRCSDFACEHGLSVGLRYDAESTFFNRKCICDEDWAGDLCNIPIADQCNERGQYIKGRCKCHGYYFGPKCQYVGKCVNGKLQEGKCHCNYGYEGDYCDAIVCHHGYRDKTNNSESCVCPPRHKGMFCDECLLEGPHILPFPNCTEEIVPHWARLSRERTDGLILTRLVIIIVMTVALFLMVVVMYVMHWGRRRRFDPSITQDRLKAMEERQEMLQRAIFLQSNGQIRRNSRFADPNRLDHDLL